MMKKVLILTSVILLLTCTLAFADEDDKEFGLDISVSGGYDAPLNLNNKPVEFDIDEQYDPVAPSIFIRIGLGVYGQGLDMMDIGKKAENKSRFKFMVNRTFAFEYSRHSFEGKHADLTLDCFGLSDRVSVHPFKYLSIMSGEGNGLYVLSSDPELDTTFTFADYTQDIGARVGKVHFTDNMFLGLGTSFGKTPFLELSLDIRMDTFYPRYVFWKEAIRGGTYKAIMTIFNVTAEHTGVWALEPAGRMVAMLLETFNLNFYPESIGETHQHFFTPSLTLTVHF
ncbi:hypothetical protein JXI42_03155 [bacterium]|nr:hypothetical protein [bacterium]